MYEAIRQQALDHCEWREERDGSLALKYVEAWRYGGDSQPDTTDFETGTLSTEAGLKAWLARADGPGKRQPKDKIVARIRLLACERSGYALNFSFSRQTFESIESVFHLSPVTVPSFESEAGTHSRFLSYAENDESKLRFIQQIMKVPQKREILNWGLSLCHDMHSSTTTGILYGKGLSSQTIDARNDRYEQCGRTAFDMFVKSIEAASPHWSHPALLPCLFLSEHLACINAFSTRGKVLTETWMIEHALDVTKVGQAAYHNKDSKDLDVVKVDSSDALQRTGSQQDPSAGPSVTLSREATKALTIRINTQSTRVAFTARSPEWTIACTRFMLKTLDEIQPHLAAFQQKGQHDCRQLLEHNITLAEAAASNIAVIKERMALQLAVLYNFIAQIDNQVSAQLAATSAELTASASRDSTSMKILAFISALFLPGSFISAIFSMDLIDWKENGEGAVVSDKFWIYWAAALPLTAVTILGWAFWWYFELGRYGRRINTIRARPVLNGGASLKQGP